MAYFLDSPEIKEESTGNLVRDIFVNRYPDQNLFLVRFYDKQTEETDTLDVLLSRGSAKERLEYMRARACGTKPPNDFYLIEATPLELEDGKMDEMNGDLIEKEAITNIYGILEWQMTVES
jgi:hypothetical protein